MSFFRKAHYMMQHGSTEFRQYCRWRRNNLMRQEGLREIRDGLELAYLESIHLPEEEEEYWTDWEAWDIMRAAYFSR